VSSLDPKTPSSGREYWRSLDARAETPLAQEYLHREFTEGASELFDGVSRRKFLSLMSASVALATFAGCRKPVEKIIPYVVPPENLVPGIPQYYATTMPLGAHAYGLLVEAHEGRPTKIEGNTKHPATRGRSNAILQAAILGLYDPDRSRVVLHNGGERTWADFVAFWRPLLEKHRQAGGAGLAILSEEFASPTLARLKAEFHAAFPQGKWVAYEPMASENALRGTAAALGQALRPVHRFDRAARVLALDCDFLLTEPESITATTDFAARRQMLSPADEMNRLHVVEGGYSLTGTMADHRLRLKAGRIGAFAATLANLLRERGLVVAGGQLPSDSAIDRDWLAAVADDLMAHRGASLVCAGMAQPPAVHALVAAINFALGNVGQTVEYRPLPDAALSDSDQLAALTDAMQAGTVDTLVMLGGNPVYNAPADLKFAAALAKVANTIHLSPYQDETSRRSHWHLPRAHFLEAWGDARAVDGTLSVMQPLIEPLFNGHSDIELAELIASGRETRGYDLVRATWTGLLPNPGFEMAWQKVLHDGVLENSAVPPVEAVIDPPRLAEHLAAHAWSSEAAGLELTFAPSPSVHDGRFANNGWLQELPNSLTKVTWDNPAIISPATARRLGFETLPTLKSNHVDLARLELNGRSLEIPVWVQPGQADDTVTVFVGYGREGLGRVADGVGFDVYPLRTRAAAFIAAGASLQPTGRTYPIAATQEHGAMEGRPIVREGTIKEFRQNPEFARDMVKHPPLVSLWKEHSYDEGHQWGMSIDLSMCTGCNACTIACQSENNIPVVGKEQVSRGREMHWIRVDRYFTGDEDAPEVVHQPVACVHCENAPCEQVCPVAATVHSADGLNQMVYNRCIGTRYCSNNCPYKVRRFNFFNYVNETPDVMKMAMNPDVTMRFRGVMEKCTYCVQRISRGRINAKAEGRDLIDGDIVSACQQACPAGAIVFGNINDPDSRVSRMRQLAQRYELLGEYNTQPRTSFLAKLRNPNPALLAATSGRTASA
jgi:molybdopterin-containing oxidoreductase family iron-sulfur binding subunit